MSEETPIIYPGEGPGCEPPTIRVPIEPAFDAEGWDMIDSAPRDGTPVLIWDRVAISMAHYEIPSTLEDWWDDVGDDGPPDEDGYAEYVEDAPHGWVLYCTMGDEGITYPTHWHPLPKLPVQP
jgi:hypothetical protein